MDALQGKTILVISPQSWGKMLVSKHHYALELARMGNQVYFLNPPDQEGRLPAGSIGIRASEIRENLFFIDHRLSFPYKLKFHFIGLFHFLMRPHVRKILRAIGKPVDIVWSFDLGHLYPFSHFPATSLKLFHPVDEPLNPTAFDSAAGAQLIFSVTREILDKYAASGVPGYFINHGVAEEFLQQEDDHTETGNPVRVGFSGNLLRGDIDRNTFLRIVEENPAIVFECWGAFQAAHSNIGGTDNSAVEDFVARLKTSPNVKLHGVVDTGTLSTELRRMDAFLICYDINKDQSKGTNYHKIMEYLGTGKVIISNNVTTYHGRPDLVRMTEERDNNRALPALFSEVTSHLEEANSPALMNTRRQFARDNTYARQIGRIEKIITQR